MLLTNLYVLRKRLDFLKNFGKLSRWLDFHIFCGLVGPTFIVFHSDFKVNGLVAISFWSMLIAASSGVVGKFFYIHSASSRQSHLDRAKKLLAKLEEYIKNSNVVVSESDLGKLKQNAKQYVGAPMRLENASLFLFPVTVFRTICGDFRLMFGYPQTYPGLPAKTRYVLREYALEVREAAYAEPFHRMLGYWHTFHMPFTYFMYITAIIHVVAALMFGVAK